MPIPTRLTDDAVGRADGVPHAADERDPQKVLHGLPSHLEPLRLCKVTVACSGVGAFK